MRIVWRQLGAHVPMIVVEDFAAAAGYLVSRLARLCALPIVRNDNDGSLVAAHRSRPERASLNERSPRRSNRQEGLGCLGHIHCLAFRTRDPACRNAGLERGEKSGLMHVVVIST
jgi:hypothetical protein